MAEQHIHVEVLASGPQKPISETHRFALLALGAFGCMCCSFSYAFNLISGEMQKRYDLSQRDLSTITTVGIVFQYTCLPYAFIYDYVGPIPIAAIAFTTFTVGSTTLALCFRGVVEGSVVRLSVFNAAMVTGCAMFDLMCCVTVIIHFPTRKGPVIALFKTFTGLGSAIVGAMYTGFFEGHPDWYFFFLMALVIVISTLCLIFLRLPPYHLTGYQQTHLSEGERQERLATKAQYLKQDPPSMVFYYGYAVIVILIIYLPLTSALVAYLKLGKSYKVAFGVVAAVLTVIFLLVSFPLMWRRIGECFGYHDKKKKHETSGRGTSHQSSHEAHTEQREGIVDSSVEPDGDADSEGKAVVLADTDVDHIAPQYPEPFFHNLLTPDLWALWWSLFSLVGTETVVIYNASYILGALAGEMPSDSMRTLLTVLNGVGSAAGRLLMSYFESWSQSRPVEKRVPITICLYFPSITVTLTIVLFLALPEKALPLPYIIAAFGNGFVASTTLLVTRTIYAKDPAKHYNFCFTATTVAVIALNRFLYGEWYTKQAEKQPNGGQICYGKRCVLMPLLVLLGLACSAVLSSTLLHLRYSKFCRLILAERRRVREEILCAERKDIAYVDPIASDIN